MKFKIYAHRFFSPPMNKIQTTCMTKSDADCDDSFDKYLIKFELYTLFTNATVKRFKN